MESQFAHLRQRDTSVPMLRVKMSRRRSQSQKENRERVVNTRRRLDKLPELDTSVAVANMSVIQEKPQNTKPAKNVAGEDRLKQLERWKERKALEKQKKERERKGVFKTGLYHPKDSIALVTLPAAPQKTNETKVNMIPFQNIRVTRSMKQHPQVEKTQVVNSVSKKVQPPVERSTRSRTAAVKSTATVTKVSAVSLARSTTRPSVKAVPVVTDKPKEKAAVNVKTTKSRVVKPLEPPSGRDRNSKGAISTTQPAGVKELKLKELNLQDPEKTPHAPNLVSSTEKERMVVGHASTDCLLSGDSETANSFAPEGFVFQAPAGLSSFKFEPLTPRSADSFLSPSFNLPPVLTFNAELPTPPKSPAHLSPCTSHSVAPASPGSPLESKHDVPYFRGVIASETDRLTVLCGQWESKVEDELIPEEMRDRMRTAVGQARLLMKERFNQFSGLVDDCELGRGEKITTCTDLQGFWDMVYYQVEDVNKKFDSLKEAEGRDWVEENKPAPRQRKLLKKQPAAPAKPTETKAAAKLRLAAVKAAMKAKQQAIEAARAAKDASNVEEKGCLNSEERPIQTEAQIADTVTFDGGFFKVESPAKQSGLVRRSSHLSATVLLQASPSSSSLTPRRTTRRSLALAQTPVSAGASLPQLVLPNPHHCLTLAQTPLQASQLQCGNLMASPCQKEKDTVNVSLCVNPVTEVLSDETQPDNSAEQSDNTVSELGTRSLVDSLQPISKAPIETQDSVCCTPNSPLVEDIPGLDFERYLRPSQRGSLSGAVAMETHSPMAVDIEMESPRALSGVSSDLTLQSPQVCPAESALLPFTPHVKNQIRQSVCPSDLMVFTPPSNM
ncbi:disks large-associated protein 5 isoform X2 [Betta splendens]|uniref:Disks large-associated protein 5 isoform X2 n=1 Tax=Betta splendens TaxID=158456 RepID=A0A6P7L766_BETSP|nr:disks large-associated protein 5 isoform X2 [Betta splendens]